MSDDLTDKELAEEEILHEDRGGVCVACGNVGGEWPCRTFRPPDEPNYRPVRTTRGWRWFLGLVLIGTACAVLQPEQPQSAIATALLVTALILMDDRY